MKALVLEKNAPIETSPLQWKEVPTPEPEEHEVQIKLKTAAICRTDLHVIEAELPSQKLPLIPGHQGVGVVTKLGKKTQNLKLGDRVGVAWLRSTCEDCHFCETDRENLCQEQKFTGYHSDGVFAEYCTTPEDFVYRIPDSLSDLDSVPLLCAGIIGFRALERAQLPLGGHLALFGFGSSAHIVIQIARARGARVSVITRGETHRNLAREMGAEWVGEATAGFSSLVDSAIIFAPAGNLVPEALQILKRGGTLAIAGIYMSDIPALNYEQHLFYEKNLRSVTANTRNDGLRLIEEASQIPVRPRVHLYPFSEANRALQDLKADKIQGTGVLKID